MELLVSDVNVVWSKPYAFASEPDTVSDMGRNKTTKYDAEFHLCLLFLTH